MNPNTPNIDEFTSTLEKDYAVFDYLYDGVEKQTKIPFDEFIEKLCDTTDEYTYDKSSKKISYLYETDEMGYSGEHTTKSHKKNISVEDFYNTFDDYYFIEIFFTDITKQK